MQQSLKNVENCHSDIIYVDCVDGIEQLILPPVLKTGI